MRKCKHESHRDAVDGTRRDFRVGMVPSSALPLRHASEFDLSYGLIERVAESRGFFQVFQFPPIGNVERVVLGSALME